MTNLEQLLAALHQNRVEFVVIGGVAAVAQGSAYTTVDLDICYERSTQNCERLAGALIPFQPYLRGAPPDLPFALDAATIRAGLSFTLSTTAGDLDLIGEVAGLGTYEEVLAYSEPMELFGFVCHVLTLEGLLKAKRAAGRPKDMLLIRELEALLALRRTASDEGCTHE